MVARRQRAERLLEIASRWAMPRINIPRSNCSNSHRWRGRTTWSCCHDASIGRGAGFEDRATDCVGEYHAAETTALARRCIDLASAIPTTAVIDQRLARVSAQLRAKR